MSNGTRKKKVDFKKLLITEEEANLHYRKKSTKSSNIPQISTNKKNKSHKIMQKPKEMKEKPSEKNVTKKIKTKNPKSKEQISVNEYANKLKNFKEELIFLNKKRNAEINIEKIINFQKNYGNKSNGANDINKKNENISNDFLDKNYKEEWNNLSNNSHKNETQSQRSALIIDFYKLYLHLFESNRLDNSKPYKFVDYLITGDNLLFNIKKDKTKIEEIKRGIAIKSKNNNFLINEHLLNKFTYEFLKCDFSNSFIKKLVEKINIFLMNNTPSQKKKTVGGVGVGELNLEKKDKFTYSNFLADKLKENTNKSILSFTNDTEYFKSLIYVCNKYSKYIGKKEMPEKILLESLEKNKKILEKFKTEEKEKNLAIKEEKEYLKNLLRNKGIRKYINKKFKIFGEDIIKSNKILNELNTNIFYNFLQTLIKNKNDDDIDKLYKIFQEELIISSENKIEKSDIKNFVIQFRFLLEIEIMKRKYNDEEKNMNEISYMKKIFEYINNYINLNKEKNPDEENNSNKKGKIKNKLKLKPKKDLMLLDNNENESINSDTKNNDITITNNDMSIEQSDNEIQGKKNLEENKNNNNIYSINYNLNTNQNVISKIVPFKIPYPRNTSHINNTISNNNNNNSNNNSNIKSSLFEINNLSVNTEDIITTKSIFSDSNNNNPNKTHTHFETKRQENIKNKVKRRKNKDELNNNDFNDNNCITFGAINNSVLKEMNINNIGKYFLNKLSLGQDIFKLVIEKPKMKKIKEKEIKEENIDINNINNLKDEKENIDIKETTKEIYRKDAETRENSSKSTTKNEKIDTNPQSPISNDINNYIYNTQRIKNKNRNIDTITFNNNINTDSASDNFKEITRNNITHSPNIGVKITQKKGNESIFNINNKFLFSTNKKAINKNEKINNNYLNIQIDRQSVEIKGGNIILNIKRNTNDEEDLLIQK